MSSLPHASHTEQVALGTLLAAPGSIFNCAEKLVPEYFFDPSLRLIAQAIHDLVENNVPPDPTLTYGRLRERGDNLKVGDLEGVRRLLDFSGQPSLLPYLLDEIKKFWELRCIVEVCAELATRGKRVAGANIDEFLAHAESKFLQLSESRAGAGLVPASTVLKDTIVQLEKIMENPGQLTGVPSGFVDLDRITAGFQPSDLIILAARPAMGKTALALNIATHAAVKQERVVAFFSLEMSSEQLMQRVLATAARIESHKFRNGNISSSELERLYPEAQILQSDRLFFDDTPGISLTELSSRCRKLKRERGALDLVMVDYLQLMSAAPAGSKQPANREREISVISMGLKALAKEMRCPVVALSQLNRGLEQRPDKRPRPADLRESGSIEQDADMIMFVYRDEVYHPETPDKGVAEIIIGKNRHGALATVKLAFQSDFTSFHNLALFD